MHLKTLHCAFETGAEFLEGVRMSEGLASFRFAPKRALPPELRVGSLLLVVVELSDSAREFRAHARVIERALDGDPEVRLEFLRDESGRQDLILLAAEGESVPYRRRADPRFPCSLEARLRSRERELEGEVVDVSAGGFRILVQADLIEVGASVRLDVAAHELDDVPARVVGRIEAGPSRGLCCEWSLRNKAHRAQVDALVRVLRP